MIIPVCERCKEKKVEGIICRHCDTSYCYDCWDLNPPDMRLCSFCGEFICEECFKGMVECDIKKAPYDSKN